MDFDPWRWVAIPVWGFVMLISPVTIIVFTWLSLGLLPAACAGLALIVIFRFFLSDRLFHTWSLAAALNGRQIVEPMPVRMVRIRSQDGREIQLRLKGHLRGGSPLEGDRIRATGNWRRRVLRVRRIHCERTGAELVPRQPCAFSFAIAGACLLLVQVGWLYFAGLPEISARSQELGSGLHHPSPSSRIYQPTP